jgi:hypothetical protein
MVGIIGDWAGQLGKSGEYWMGRRGSGLVRNSELHGGSFMFEPPTVRQLGPYEQAFAM